MEQSSDVRDAFVRFCERLSAKDVATFDELVSGDPATLVIGTAPGEWVRDRGALRFGFETEGIHLEPDHPEGFEEGSMGWVVDEPTFTFPDSGTVKVRLTGVLHREGDRWKLVHAHFSVGVPDEEVATLQRAWSQE